MTAQPPGLGQVRGPLHIVKGQQLAAQRVFQRQQPGAGKVLVVGLDGRFNIRQRQSAVALVVQRLRLHAAKHRGTATLPAVAVRVLAHDVLVAALAMRQDGAQVALRAGRHKQGGRKAQHAGQLVLQGVDARVVAKHVVAQGRCQHGRAHGGRRLRHGVAA